MILPSFLNQNNEIFVSNFPFSGIPIFNIASKGEIRSVVAKRRYDGEDVVYTSCTLVVGICPLWPLHA